MPKNLEILRLLKIRKKYGETVVLDNIELSIKSGEFFTLLGESAAGKSTFLKVIAGIEKPNSGKIYFVENDITEIPPNKRPFAMVFQSYALFPHKNIFENLSFPLKRTRRFNKKEIDIKVKDLASIIGIDTILKRKIHEISGGQQQRVALGRALLKILNSDVGMENAILLMDEPLRSLDKIIKQTIQNEIKKLQNEFGLTIIYVTHDNQEALSISDRIAIIRKGKILQIGSPVQIYSKPINKYVAKLFGFSNFLKGRVKPDESIFELIDGTRLILNKNQTNSDSNSELFIHPEKISFIKNENDICNCLSIKIDEKLFQGTTTSIKGKTKTDIEIKLNKINNGEKLPELGQEVTIYWKIEDSYLLINEEDKYL